VSRLLLLLLILLPLSAEAPDPHEFARRLAVFDAPYERFKRNYCGIPESVSGPVQCQDGLKWDVVEYGKARKAAMRLFDLKDF
jgi:hypothetical protein